MPDGQQILVHALKTLRRSNSTGLLRLAVGAITIVACLALMGILMFLAGSLDPLRSVGALYLTFAAYIVYRWGWPPGILALLAGFILYRFFFLTPIYSLGIPSRSDTIHLTTLVLSTVPVLAFVQFTRIRRQEAEATSARLAAQVAELRQYHEREARLRFLQRVLDQLPTGVIILSGSDARLALVNRAIYTTLACEWLADEPLRDFVRRTGIQVFSADGQALTIDDLAAMWVIKGGKVPGHQEKVEGSVRLPSGVTIPLLASATMLDIDVETGEHQVALVLQDISALKEAERAKDEFIAVAAHELRTPLTALKGFTQLLLRPSKRREAAELVPWQRKALQEIESSIDRLELMTNDLLDIARLTHGHLQLRPGYHDLVQTVRRVVAHLQVTSDIHRIRVDTEVESLPVWMDEQRMVQVFHNLIGNAIKYSPAGGPITVTIRRMAQEAAALVSVRDRGLGIPQEEQGLLFRRFTRSSNAVEIGITGTGLGLYLCRELVERHGGQIWLESTHGQGSVFFVKLPLNVGGSELVSAVPSPQGIKSRSNYLAGSPAADA